MVSLGAFWVQVQQTCCDSIGFPRCKTHMLVINRDCPGVETLPWAWESSSMRHGPPQIDYCETSKTMGRRCDSAAIGVQFEVCSKHNSYPFRVKIRANPSMHDILSHRIASPCLAPHHIASLRFSIALLCTALHCIALYHAHRIAWHRNSLPMHSIARASQLPISHRRCHKQERK